MNRRRRAPAGRGWSGQTIHGSIRRESWLIQVDGAGNILWQRRYGPERYGAYVVSATPDPASGYLALSRGYEEGGTSSYGNQFVIFDVSPTGLLANCAWSSQDTTANMRKSVFTSKALQLVSTSRTFVPFTPKTKQAPVSTEVVDLCDPIPAAR